MINVNLNCQPIISDGKESKVFENEINIYGGTYCIILDSLPITIFITEDVSIRKLYKLLKKRLKIKL